MLVDTAIILCGGRGTRFRNSAEAEIVAQHAVQNFKSYPPPRTSFTLEAVKELRDTPKCLVPVCGKPLLWHKIDQLARAGVKEIILCAGKNTEATRDSLANFPSAHPATVSFAPRSFFGCEDLGYIERALKGRPAETHVILTAGDCLTTTDFQHLATEHARNNSYLTIATHEVNGDRSFIQDAVASTRFISKASRETRQNQSRFHHCSPLLAAIHNAWHNHELVEVSNSADHININTIKDFERLISDPARFIPVSALGQPKLLAASLLERHREFGLRP
jgi:NDP-sugar pyrophosphorylase family protein